MLSCAVMSLFEFFWRISFSLALGSKEGSTDESNTGLVSGSSINKTDTSSSQTFSLTEIFL